MVELLITAVLAFAIVLAIVTVVSVLAALFGLILLPLKLFGLMLQGVGFLIALPFILLAVAIGAIVLGAGALVLLSPLLPFAILGGVIWLLVRGRRRAQAA